jgi:hypothetical protein
MRSKHQLYGKVGFIKLTNTHREMYIFTRITKRILEVGDGTD